MDKMLQTLSMCRRAGRLMVGFDSVKAASVQQKACLLVVSDELSQKTLKEVVYLKEKYHLPLLSLHAGLDELWRITGKRAGVYAITDSSLAEKLIMDASLANAKQEEKQ